MGGRGDERRVRAAAVAAVDEHRLGPAGAGGACAATPLRHPPRGRAAADPGPLVADRAAVRARRRRSRRAPPRAGRAAARALRDRHPRARARRGHPRRLLVPVRLVRRARDDRRVPARLLRRRPRRRAVRAAGCGGAAPRAARRRRRAAGRAGGDRSRAALRRGAQVAAARDALPVAPGGRARRARPARSRCSTSSAAARACRCWSRRTTRASTARSRRSPPSVERGRIRKLGIEKVNGEPVIGSPWEERLLALGFRAGPRKLTIGA